MTLLLSSLTAVSSNSNSNAMIESYDSFFIPPNVYSQERESASSLDTVKPLDNVHICLSIVHANACV